jgi:hypothetical protein
MLSFLSAALLIVGCGGDEAAELPDAGDPRGEGIVGRVSGMLKDGQGVEPERGRMRLEFNLGEAVVTEKVWLELTTEGVDIGEGPGNKEFDLSPGLYSARVSYVEDSHVDKAKGVLSALRVHAGMISDYKVYLDVPIGRLQMDFTQLNRTGKRVSIAEQVPLAVHRAGDQQGIPVWEGLATEAVVLAAGSYDIRAALPGKDGIAIVEWIRDVAIVGGMVVTNRTVEVESEDTGVRIDVFNFSADVNGKAHVAFFPPDADLRRAVARYTGKGGQVLPVAPGTYDVLVRYAPSSEIEGDRLLEDLVVPTEGALRLQVDLEQELGMLRLSVFDGDRSVSDQVNMIVRRSGADRVAGLSVLDAVGVGEHHIGAGTYDIYLEYQPSSGKKKRVTLEGVTIASGAVWEQRFEAEATRWLPAPARLPTEPLRSIHWSPPPPPALVSEDDDDSASDDDDSASDDTAKAGDDHGSARPAAAQSAEPTEKPADPPVVKGGVPEHERGEAPTAPPSGGP